MMNCADRRFRVLNQNDSTVKVVRYMLFWQAIDGARPSALSSLTKRSVTISIIYAIEAHRSTDRKSTRLNSSHVSISYAVFCLKKKKKNIILNPMTYKLNNDFISH